MPVNIAVISAEKFPSYRFAIILGKIVDFRLGKNRARESIAIPVIRIIALTSPFSFTDKASEIIINQNAKSVVTNPEADSWRMSYRADGRASVSAYLVKSICHPNGICTTFEEAGRRAVEKDRKKSRRGE